MTPNTARRQPPPGVVVAAACTLIGVALVVCSALVPGDQTPPPDETQKLRDAVADQREVVSRLAAQERSGAAVELALGDRKRRFAELDRQLIAAEHTTRTATDALRYGGLLLASLGVGGLARSWPVRSTPAPTASPRFSPPFSPSGRGGSPGRV